MKHMMKMKMLKPLCVNINSLPEEALKLTLKENMRIQKNLVKSWHLGPARGSDDRTANAPFWNSIAMVFRIKPLEARRRNCGNCEYGFTSPKHLEAMEHIPDTEGDLDGGGRVWCDKFDFICHNRRICQSWEMKD